MPDAYSQQEIGGRFPYGKRLVVGRLLSILLLVAAVSARRAQAESPPAVAPQSAPPAWDASLRGSVGLAGGTGPTLLVDPEARLRFSYLLVGLGGRLGLYGGLGSSLGFAGQAGLALPVRQLRFELTATAGLNSFHELERRELVGGDPGYDVRLPFAGAKLSAAWLFGRGRFRPFGGLTFLFERDLAHGTRHYEYVAGLLDDTLNQASHAYGWTRLGVLLAAGVYYLPSL